MTYEERRNQLRERHKKAYISPAAKAAAQFIMDYDSMDDLNLLGQEGIEMVIQDAIDAETPVNKFG